jgi:small subunit ribosomal protein S6
LTDWGRRRLAYPIERHFEAHYLIAEYTAENGAGNQPLDRALSLDTSVLRHLIIRTDD